VWSISGSQQNDDVRNNNYCSWRNRCGNLPRDADFAGARCTRMEEEMSDYTDAEMEDCYLCNGVGYAFYSSIGSFKECPLCKGTGRVPK